MNIKYMLGTAALGVALLLGAVPASAEISPSDQQVAAERASQESTLEYNQVEAEGHEAVAEVAEWAKTSCEAVVDLAASGTPIEAAVRVYDAIRDAAEGAGNDNDKDKDN